MNKVNSIPNQILPARFDWSDASAQAQIKEQYGKTLTDEEWKHFLALGLSTGLSPYLREIWAVKYGSGPASIFIGRDGYRRSAQSHPDYDYHYADAVYENDKYKVVNGEVSHEYSLKDRGKIIGAYCVVKRKGSSRPAVTFADFKEYSQPYGVWKSKPATMIKKVSESQGLRASFQELFAGTYEESENWQQEESKPFYEEAKTQSSVKKLHDAWSKYKLVCNMPEAESNSRKHEMLKELFQEYEMGAQLTEEQTERVLKRINEMIKEAGA